MADRRRKNPAVPYEARDARNGGIVWRCADAARLADLYNSALKLQLSMCRLSPVEEAIGLEIIGDLDEMLYPAALTPETEIYYDRIQTFAYVGEVESNFDPRITTVNPVKSGSLVMYRDSFGNTLLPFLADAYSSAYFSRGVPYQLSDVDTMAADTVIVERAERFLPEMAENPPVMEAPLALPSGEENTVAEDGVPDVSMALQGTVYKISGWISPEYLDWDSEIYIRLNGEMLYEAFPADVEAGESLRDTGFVLYLGAEKIPAGEAGLEILVEKDGVLNNIASLTVSAQVPAAS